MKKLVLMLVMLFSTFTMVGAQEANPCDGVYVDGAYLSNGVTQLEYYDHDFNQDGQYGATRVALYDSIANEFSLINFEPGLYRTDVQKSPNGQFLAWIYSPAHNQNGLTIYSSDGTNVKLTPGRSISQFVWAPDSLGFYVASRDYTTGTIAYLYLGLDGTQNVLFEETYDYDEIFGAPHKGNDSFIYGKKTKNVVELYEVGKDGETTTLIKTITFPLSYVVPYRITISGSGNILAIGYAMPDEAQKKWFPGVAFWDMRDDDTFVTFMPEFDSTNGLWNTGDVYGYFVSDNTLSLPIFHTLDFSELGTLKHSDYPLSAGQHSGEFPGEFDWVDQDHILTFETYPMIVNIRTGERKSELDALCKPVSS